MSDLDRLRTQMQETGRCSDRSLTLAEASEIAADLGIDPAEIVLFAGDHLAYVVMRREPASGAGT